MTRILLLAGRELGALLKSPFGWVIIALVLVLDGVLFNGLAMDGERSTSEVVEKFFYFSAGVTMTASIFIAMRALAAEREQRTLVLLLTAPLSEWQVIMGKYLGALAFLCILIGATVYMPLLISVNGDVSWPQVAAGYLGLVLLGGATTAIALFGSSLAKNQLLAAIIGGVMVVFFLTTWYLSKAVEPPLKDVLSYTALFNKHYKPFMEGTVHLRSIVYFATLAVLFLLGSVRVLQSRRWR